jgi:hypothetical protein
LDLGQTFTDFIATVGNGQYKPQRKFLRDVLYGLLASRSVVLASIARALDEPCRLIHTEKRLSENLKSERFNDEEMRARYLKHAAPLLRQKGHRVPTIAVDKTDIAKPWAEKMPHLAMVRDASLPYRPRTRSGESAEPILVPGYDLLSIEAVGDNGRRLPLTTRLYSHKDPECRKERGETRRAILEVKPHVPKEALWTFDRGYCNRPMIDMLNGVKIRWICRMSLGQPMEVYANGHRGLVHQIVPLVRMRTKFRVRKHKESKKRVWNIQAGWIADVHLVNDSFVGSGPLATKQSIVVITNNIGNEPIVLLTNVRVESAEAAREIAHAYHERWGVEEAHRFVKQAFDLEDVRALTWTGLKRIALLVMLAYGYLATLVHRWRPEAERIAAKFKAFGPVPLFLHYRLLAGIAGLLKSVFTNGP